MIKDYFQKGKIVKQKKYIKFLIDDEKQYSIDEKYLKEQKLLRREQKLRNILDLNKTNLEK